MAEETKENQTGTTEEPARRWRPQDADREYIKYSTRTRVRNATVPPQAIFHPAKPQPNIMDSGHKKVAVYARVSTKSTEQVSSIENQTKYYTEKIQKTADWEMHEIYSDEGKSGTSTKHRTEFKRMISDAADKKMDLILCASVSRFARNISDLIEEVRKLKTTNPTHPVGVYFETEDIYTLDSNIDERLQMHALFAEWESKNKSRRMILSYDQRICTGQYPVADLLGYRHTIDGELIIQEEEAKTVRYIFLAYICGYSLTEIARQLTAKGRKTLKGNTEWTCSMVKAVMYNERRWGDLEARKTVVIDMKEHISIKNTEIRDGASIPNHHEGIVSHEIANAAHLMPGSSLTYRNGVPDICVIDSGALKGFVSVSPLWGGIDNDTFTTVCKHVYEDVEFDELQHDARIMTGEEHSKILSMDFAGYEVPYGVVFMTRSSPQLTISSKEIHLNRVCHTRLDDCEYVEVLYHPILEVIALRSCAADNPNAVKWKDENGIQLTTHAFSKAIFDKMTWIKKYKFRFRGISRERGDEKMLLFFLDEPQILVGSAKKKVDDEYSGDKSTVARYILYTETDAKESSVNETEVTKRTIAYPQAWRDRIGVSYEIKKRRNSLFDSLTDKDIRAGGIKVIHPLIGGEIPSRQEVEDELEQLYMSM